MDQLQSQVLTEHFEAKIYQSRSCFYNYPPEPTISAWNCEQDTWVYQPPVRTPCVEIVLPSHKMNMLCGVLDEMFETCGEDVGNPMLRWANNVMQRNEREFNIRKNNPVVKELWEQYQTALKLCV
jgi:hypothetical protein